MKSELTPFGKSLGEADKSLVRRGKHTARSEVGSKLSMPSRADVDVANKELRKYGITIDMKALAAERAVRAGYPVKDLGTVLGKDYVLYQLIRDLNATNNRDVRRKLLESMALVLGVVQQGGGNQFNAIHITELGTRPDSKPVLDVKAEPVSIQ